MGVLGLICILRPPEVILEQTDSGFERRTGQIIRVSRDSADRRTDSELELWVPYFDTMCILGQSDLLCVAKMTCVK